MKRPTLLLIEDHATSRLLTRLALERAGYVVHEARDSATAVSLMQAHQPRLVIQDLGLPDCDAFALAPRLRSIAHRDRLRMVALSGLLTAEETSRLWQAGFDDVITKPVDPTALLALVEAQFGLLSSELASHGLAGGSELHSARGADRREQAEQPPPPAHPQAAPRRGLEEHARELLLRCSFLSAELSILKALSQAVLAQEDVEGAVVAALSTCFDASGCSLGALYLADRYQQLRVRPLGAFSADDVRELSSFFGQESWLRELLKEGHPRMMLLGAPDGDDPARAVLARARVYCGIVVPLIHLGAPLGALFMAVREGEQHADLEQCRNFVLNIAAQVANALALSEAFRAREVAEREAEQQRRLAREQAAVFRALVECAPDVIMHLDRAGKVRFINRAPHGFTLERARELTLFELMGPEYLADMRSAFAAVLREGAAKTIETTTVGSDGTLLWIESHIGPICSGGEVVGAVAIQRDVSHKKQAEAQLIIADRMASIATLAAGVAHEINNPLASVMANLDLALHEIDAPNANASADLRDELRDAHAAAERVRSIVRDLRVFAQVDEQQRGAIDVERVLDSAVRLAGNEVRHRARMVRKYEPVPPVDANEARLGQVFLNLLVNAAQGIEQGGAESNELGVELRQDAQGRVVVSIIERAIGAADPARPRAYPPNLSSKRPPAARGLALAMCHRVVTGLGGTIRVESEGDRSAFHVVLPASGTHGGLASNLRPERAARDAGRRRVLVVDDDPATAQLVRGALTPEHDVFSLERPGEALASLQAGERFDAILCPVLMPAMSGMDFHGELARAYPEQAERIVFFTGGALEPGVAQFLERVKNLRIEKPVDAQQLRALIYSLGC